MTCVLEAYIESVCYSNQMVCAPRAGGVTLLRDARRAHVSRKRDSDCTRFDTDDDSEVDVPCLLQLFPS
jgi:hypothetical protein